MISRMDESAFSCTGKTRLVTRQKLTGEFDALKLDKVGGALYRLRGKPVLLHVVR